MRAVYLGSLLLLLTTLMACRDVSTPAPEPVPVPETAPSSQPAEEPSADVSASNPQQPSLRVTTIDGDMFDLAEQRGTWVVVNFWATWCGPCIKEIPDLSAFDTARDDVRVIGLAYEDIGVEDLKVFLSKHPASYAIAIIDVYDPPADFDAPRGLPMTYLIAPDGQVASKFLGPVTSDDLARAITAAQS